LPGRLSQRHSSSGLPLWFTLAWEGGTLQWADPRAPHGSWTLYQTHGVFRIRGPQTTFVMQGALEEARAIRLQFGSFGPRWNAMVRVSDADCRSALALARTLAKRDWLPHDWSARGKFDFEARAAGRHLPVRGENWLLFLNEARFSFIPEGTAPKAENPSIIFNGSLTYKNGILSGPSVSVACPWFQGTGRADLRLQEIHPHPDIYLNADVAAGRVGSWAFHNAVIRLHYVNDHWEFLQNNVHFLDGSVSVKGYLGPAASDLAVTAENLSLAALGKEHGLTALEGRLNGSCSLKGPLDHWQTTGSWWLAGLQWGTTAIGDARGSFDIAPDYFHAEGKSDDSRFRFSSEGSLSDKTIAVDQLEIYFPTGASLTANASIDRVSHRVQGIIDASNVDFPTDIPSLAAASTTLKGRVIAHARLSGAWENPTLKGSLQSADMTVGSRPVGKVFANYVWSPSQVDVPVFHLGSGVYGRYSLQTGPSSGWSLDMSFDQTPAALLNIFAPYPPVTEGALTGTLHIERRHDFVGHGSLNLQNTLVGKYPLDRAAFRFGLAPGHFRITELSAETHAAVLRWSGQASWNPEETIPKHLTLSGLGMLHAASDPDAWEIPFNLSGKLDSATSGWSGETRIAANHSFLQKQPLDAFEVVLEWRPGRVSWNNAHWGRHWSSVGTLKWDRESAVCSGRVHADQVLLERWQPLLWPKMKTELHGVLDGTWTFEGAPDHSHGDLSLALVDGRWRALEFSTTLAGSWSSEGIKPLTLKGRINSGGNFQFTGLLTPDQEVQGTLKLSALNIHPLGESLGVPKPLEGLMTATLTLNGPLSRLACSGHLEGGPVSYGKTAEAVFKLEKVTMDMTLAPLESDPSIEHMTLTEGQAATSEELVRFQSGGFVEFAGQKPARLKLGMDIRNLHLGFFTLFGGLDLDGFWQIKPEGFAIEAKAHTHQLFINDYELEEGLVLVDYYDKLLEFLVPPDAPPLVTGSINFHKAPQLQFTDFSISGKDRQGVRISGDIGPSLWDFRMSGHGLDMGTLSELSGFPYPMSGSADVQVRGTGDPKHPHVEGNIDLDRGTLVGLAFRTGTASFIWQDARISFTKLSLTDSGHYTLEGAGVFPLVTSGKIGGEDHSIDFSIRLLDSNLSLLQSFMPEVKQAKGPVDGLLQIKGTLEDPSLHGSLHVANGEVQGAHYFRQLRGAALTVDFDRNNVIIRDLRGKSGNGEFRGSGTITLSGFQPSKYDLKLAIVSSKGVEVLVPELAIPDSPLAKRFRFLTTSSRGDVRGHAELTGPADAPVFSGSAIISNGHFTFPPSRKHPPNPAVLEWFRRITWDVDLKFQDGAWFENELVQAGVTGTLKLRGPSDKLRVDGGLDITEGTISYLGLQFDVQEARYDVRSEASGDTVVNTPYVRGVAESQIQAVDTVSGVAGASGGSRLSVNDTITLNIDYAPVDQIKPRLTSASNPTLSQDKILARVTQTDVENLTPQEQTALYQKQMMTLIDTSLTTPLAQNVLKKTGIADRVRVQHVFDPNTVSAQDLNTAAAVQQQQSTGVNLFANTKYTIEKDLSNRLSLGYGIRFVPSASVDPDLQQQKLDLISDVQLSYRWFRNVYVKGDFDLPSSNPTIVPERKVTIEPRWRFGWWGNTNKDKEQPKSSP